MTRSAGFGAAWPRPQIDASTIACDSSFSSGWSQLRPLHQRERLGRADAAGRALAAGLVARRTSSGCARRPTRVSWSDRTTIAAEPMKQPYWFSVSKSSGMSAIDAGRMPPDAPPGR